MELKKVVHAVLDRMDHQWLNDLPPFDKLNPSAENMAKYIYDEVAEGLRSQPASGSAPCASGKPIPPAPPTGRTD